MVKMDRVSKMKCFDDFDSLERRKKELRKIPGNTDITHLLEFRNGVPVICGLKAGYSEDYLDKVSEDIQYLSFDDELKNKLFSEFGATPHYKENEDGWTNQLSVTIVTDQVHIDCLNEYISKNFDYFERKYSSEYGFEDDREYLNEYHAEYTASLFALSIDLCSVYNEYNITVTCLVDNKDFYCLINQLIDNMN